VDGLSKFVNCEALSIAPADWEVGGGRAGWEEGCGGRRGTWPTPNLRVPPQCIVQHTRATWLPCIGAAGHACAPAPKHKVRLTFTPSKTHDPPDPARPHHAQLQYDRPSLDFSRMVLPKLESLTAMKINMKVGGGGPPLLTYCWAVLWVRAGFRLMPLYIFPVGGGGVGE
jgi:hypothetical protein